MNYNYLGYRFSPTEEEIISHFLEKKMQGLPVQAINTLNICEFEPWQLPEKAAIRDNDDEWYFISEINKKYTNSNRAERTTKAGYWKVTGNDRQIFDECRNFIGVKKNLVFYKGRGSKATKTNWVIHEYHSANASAYQKPYVLCRLRENSGESSGRAAADT